MFNYNFQCILTVERSVLNKFKLKMLSNRIVKKEEIIKSQLKSQKQKQNNNWKVHEYRVNKI